MVTQLLDISRLEAGRMPLNRVANDLRATVQAVQENLSALAADRRMADLHRAGPGAGAVYDPEVVGRILTNLLANALKFTVPKDEVIVGITRQDAFARVSVTDHGPAIPADQREKIFEKFTQAEGEAEVRHRAGADLLQAGRGGARRHHRRGQHRRTGQHLLVHPAPGIGAGFVIEPERRKPPGERARPGRLFSHPRGKPRWYRIDPPLESGSVCPDGLAGEDAASDPPGTGVLPNIGAWVYTKLTKRGFGGRTGPSRQGRGRPPSENPQPALDSRPRFCIITFRVY